MVKSETVFCKERLIVERVAMQAAFSVLTLNVLVCCTIHQEGLSASCQLIAVNKLIHTNLEIATKMVVCVCRRINRHCLWLQRAAKSAT